jgi:hypothetical protein
MIAARIDEPEGLLLRGREDDGVADHPAVEIDVGFGVYGHIAELSGQRHRTGIAGKSGPRGKREIARKRRKHRKFETRISKLETNSKSELRNNRNDTDSPRRLFWKISVFPELFRIV